jgi:hypothetical protein
MKRFVLATFVATLLAGAAAWAQTVDANGKELSPVKIDKGKKEGVAALEEAKGKAEKACQATFSYSLDWEKEFKPSTWDRTSFKGYHIGRDCGIAFDSLKQLCDKSPENKKYVKQYVKKVVCKLHPQFHPLAKWMKENGVDRQVRYTLMKNYRKKFDEFFKSNCVTGPRVQTDKHVLCELKDGTFTVQYSLWSVNNDSQITGYLKKYFSD